MNIYEQFNHSFSIIWIIGTITSWYLIYTFTLMLNGGRNPIRTFFTQDLLWYIPGGLKRRIEYVKKMIQGAGEFDSTIGKKHSWIDREVVEKELYEEYVKDVLQSPFSFWIGNIIVPIMLGYFTPLFFYIFIFAIILLLLSLTTLFFVKSGRWILMKVGL